MKAVFPTSKSEIISEGDYDVAVLHFGVSNSRGIMQFFANARRNREGQIRIQIEPYHNPDRMILTHMDKTRVTGMFNFGYAVDQIGSGKSGEGLMPATPFVPIDPASVMQEQQTGPAPVDATFNVDGDGNGNPILTVAVAFPKVKANA